MKIGDSFKLLYWKHRGRITENWKKKKIQALKNAVVTVVIVEGQRYLSKIVKATQRKSRSLQSMPARYKRGKKTLKSTFEESPKHIKGLFKSIKRRKLE